MRGLTEDLFDRMICEYPNTVNVHHSLWASEKRLGIINLLTECQGHSVAAGDGVPDLWSGFRVNVGIRYVCHLASTGSPERALDELEHLTDFVEALFGLSEGTELTYRCRAFDKLSGMVSFAILPHSWDNGRDHKALTIRNDAYGIFECIFIYNLIFWLTTQNGWEWFDPIRNHPRYIACVERLKKLDV